MNDKTEIKVGEYLKDAYSAFGRHVNTQRATAQLLDGCKPVTRRVLYASYLLGNKLVKSATIMGKTIGEYHPHCFYNPASGGVFETSGKITPIQDMVGVESAEVYSYDTEQRSVKRSISTDFRVGKITDDYYKVMINNKYEIWVTDNHEFCCVDLTRTKSCRLEGDLIWVRGDQLRERQLLNSLLISERNYIDPTGHDGTIYRIDADLDEFEAVHHIDCNPYNNSRDNLLGCGCVEHIKIHHELKGDPYKEAHDLQKSNSFYKNRKRFRDSKIMWYMNTCQGFIKCCQVFDQMTAKGIEITPDNYEENRPEDVSGIRNPSTVQVLIWNYNLINSWDDILNWYEIYKSEGVLMTCIKLWEHEYFFGTEDFYPEDLRFPELNIPKSNNWNRHDAVNELKHYLETGEGDFNKIEIGGYMVVTSVEHVKSEEPVTFYDFTNEEYHSMFLALNNDLDDLKLINLHNSDSSIYGTVVGLVKAGILQGQGQWGSQAMLPEGVTNASAPRYTEAKLKDSFYEFFNMLMDFVPFVDSELDGYTLPEYLPTPIPISLITGTFGIGFGMNVTMPAFTPKSLLEAYLKDDPKLLRMPYDLWVDYTLSEFDKLWLDGSGNIICSLKVEQGYSLDGTSWGTIISGDPDLFKPTITDALAEMIDAGKVRLRDESGPLGPRLFIGREKRVSIITDDWIYEQCKIGSIKSLNFRINVAEGDKVGRIGIKDWIDITYKNYIRILREFLKSEVEKYEWKLTLLKYSDQVMDTFQKSNLTYSNDEIATKLGIDVTIVSDIMKLSLASWRRMDKDAKKLKYEEQLAHWKSQVPEKIVIDLVHKL